MHTFFVNYISLICVKHSSSFISPIRFSANGGHYYAYCRPNDGEQWVEFNDSRVDDVDGSVITPAAYILFFRRVFPEPRTLENLRALDERCHDDSEWMKKLLSEQALSEQAQCRGAVADDEGVLFKAASAAASMPRSSNYQSSSSDTETGYLGGGGAFSGDMAHLCI
jgi:hypothetical protein